MTINDYHLVMNGVGIAELKARLSEYLRRVRGGEALTVLDRTTPIARLVPYDGQVTPLRVRGPRAGSPKPCDAELPEPVELERDVVELLLEDRAAGR